MTSVDYDGYSISSKGFLPTIIDIMVIWVKFTHSSPFYFTDPKMLTALDFTSITSHIHTWLLFLLWFCHFILSGVICLLFSSSMLGTYWPREFIFQCHVFLPFHTVHGVLKARILEWFTIPFSRDHVLSEPSTMTHLSWVALHGMAHSFIELDKAVIHVISLVSFLWLWFSFCLPSDETG